jgi:hypothetical protein
LEGLKGGGRAVTPCGACFCLRPPGSSLLEMENAALRAELATEIALSCARAEAPPPPGAPGAAAEAAAKFRRALLLKDGLAARIDAELKAARRQVAQVGWLCPRCACCACLLAVAVVGV